MNEDQLGQLRNLKKKLEADERTQEDTSFSVNSSRRSSQMDTLFNRLASKNEGIEYKIDTHWVPAPLGLLDGKLLKFAVAIGVGPKKLAVGLPRVPVGISTWLSVSVMISRLVSSQEHEVRGRSIRLPTTMQSILVACRERSVRDLYLSQRMVFTGQSFVVQQFPIFRFRRDGRIQPISYAKPNLLSTPVLFYHFDNIDFGDSDLSLLRVRNDWILPPIRLILAEMSESDSRLSKTMLERLEYVRGVLGKPRTNVFFNSFDDQMRDYLSQNKYELVHFKPDTCVNPKMVDVPTTTSTFSRYSCPQEISVEVVHDHLDISKSLLEGARALFKVGEEIHTPECRALLARWWSIWRILKNLAIPIELYERYRMRAQGRGSLENAIGQIPTTADRIHTSEGRSLQMVAPVISNRLRAIYDNVTVSCPKAERVMSLLGEAKAQSLHDTLFVLSEKSQVDALREHLLFTDIDILNKHIPIVHLSQSVGVARTMVVRDCILSGVWAPWQDSTLIAIGASKIRVLMYPYEAPLLQARLQEHVRECDLLGQSTPGIDYYAPVFLLTPEQEGVLDDVIEAKKMGDVQTQPPDWLRKDPELTLETVEHDERTHEDERYSEGLLVALDDGSSFVVRPHSEMMLITDEGIENVFADTLAIGDTIAVMRGDVTHSIFQSVLSHVNHLVRVDDRVVELWRSTVRKILFDQDTRGARPLSVIVQSLRNLGCTRVELTIRQWFKGTTMAPQDVEDVRRILDLAGVQRAAEVARVVSREIEVIRTFNRRLGRRINEQIRASITRGAQPPKERIDFEIDEAIEAVEYKTIVAIDVFNGGGG